jgi:hypothetical protein
MLRIAFTSAIGVLIGANSIAAQEPPLSDDIAPPPEIVVAEDPEEIPPPRDPREPLSPSDVPRVLPSEGGQLRPGMFVEGVELYPHVRIEDADEIARNAVPMIIAVIDPRGGPWHPHVRRSHWRHSGQRVGAPPLVFVQVFVPPKPPQAVRVRHEEIDLYYGGRKINIDSERGIVKIDYE